MADAHALGGAALKAPRAMMDSVFDIAFPGVNRPLQ